MGFFQNFLGGPKVVKFVFSRSKPRKQAFLVKSSKSRGPFPPFPTSMVEFTLITRLLPNSANAVTDDTKHTFGAHSYTAPLEKDFNIDANRARAFMGHFHCGVETVKRFVNVQLHCNQSRIEG